MAKFTEGNKMSKGRPKGSQNSYNKEIKKRFEYIVMDNLEQMRDDIKNMKPELRCEMIIKMAKYILPTAKQIELSARDGFNPITIVIGNEDGDTD